jgi:hypothetical protein
VIYTCGDGVVNLGEVCDQVVSKPGSSAPRPIQVLGAMPNARPSRAGVASRAPARVCHFVGMASFRRTSVKSVMKENARGSRVAQRIARPWTRRALAYQVKLVRATDCKFGPRCGDGLVQSDHEQCDNGTNTDVTPQTLKLATTASTTGPMVHAVSAARCRLVAAMAWCNRTGVSSASRPRQTTLNVRKIVACPGIAGMV